MRIERFVVPAGLLLVASGCFAPPVETRTRTASLVVRVRDADGTTRVGGLVLADADSLLIYDVQAAMRFVVRPAPGDSVEVYRGQRSSSRAVAKGAGKGALQGLALGVLGGLLAGVVIGSDDWWGDIDVGSLIAAGAVYGAAGGAIEGGVEGARQGEATWERVSLLRLKQELCRCSDPDGAARAKRVAGDTRP